MVEVPLSNRQNASLKLSSDGKAGAAKMRKTIFRSFLTVIWLLLMAAGCAANYGGVKRSPDIAREFETGRLQTDLKYYARVDGGYTIAVIGLKPSLEFDSRLWRRVTPGTDEFNSLVDRIWEDYGYTIYGAEMISPQGDNIGVLYSAVDYVTLKFTDDSRIQVMLDTPWTRGPGDPGSERIP